MKGVKRKILDDLSGLMNSYIDPIESEEERTDMINDCLQVLLMFGFISGHVAGLDEDTMHDLVHETYEDLRASKQNEAN